MRLTEKKLRDLAWDAVDSFSYEGRPLSVDMDAETLVALLSRFDAGKKALAWARDKWGRENNPRCLRDVSR